MSFWQRKKRESIAIQVEDKLISSDLKDEMFACDLKACKGACCVEGDLGAPVDQEEIETLEYIYEDVKPYMRPEGIAAVEEQGTTVLDITNQYSTPLVDGRECAYVTFSEDGVALCAIEQAWQDGKVDFQKPVSCHLYPVRITSLKDFDALNYDRWSICSDACALGKKTGTPVYEFVKVGLIRKYGEEFYNEMETVLKGMDQGASDTD